MLFTKNEFVIIDDTPMFFVSVVMSVNKNNAHTAIIDRNQLFDSTNKIRNSNAKSIMSDI